MYRILLLILVAAMLLAGCARSEIGEADSRVKCMKGDFLCPSKVEDGKRCGGPTVQDMFGKHYCAKCKAIWTYKPEKVEEW